MFDSTEEHRAMTANEGAIEVAAWLLHWCPHQARAFALAMHELAAWQYDDRRTEHWHRVLGLLRAE
jgi:hypothetical protein